ncbi:MAG: hypothetical protein R2750_00295 [Bacteroidales bacterium]
MISQVIGIPGNKLVNVEILETESRKLENFTLYPFQTPTTDNPEVSTMNLSRISSFTISQKIIRAARFIWMDRAFGEM